ncbi:hypothetical protein C8D88_11195 [Lentzea atacamensis]|uniref:Uncharacterized protein n=1 Tax=Lentzea atacamensis TaxID=531938 RepID=A0A316HT44_9PSEU|nr:hypothetical protein [Lentzea atacamensis]PWK83210.1 hypothetical protein C8D88_11195 [Lentzea atacamensis]
MNDVDPELRDLLRRKEAERVAELRADYDAMTPQQRRQSYALPERLSRRWRERSPDDKVGKVIIGLTLAAVLIILAVVAGLAWLVVTLVS